MVEVEDVVLDSSLVTDKTLLFPTSQHDHGDKPRSNWLCGDRAGLVVVPGLTISHLTPASLLPLSSRGISTAAFDPSSTYFTLLRPRNISVEISIWLVFEVRKVFQE